MKTILVTGGCGFIGSSFVRHVLDTRDDWSLVNVDRLSYAGNLENVADCEGNPRYRFVKADITDRARMSQLMSEGVDAVVNFAAETHVDRSISDPAFFIANNVGGAEVLLSAAREHGVGRFVQIGTDEVYGSLGPTGRFTEDTSLHPNNPYSASKAAADLLCGAFGHTFGMEVCITRCSNNYGPYQFPEKVIPVCIANALAGKPLPLYGDGRNVREWIHVEDHCRAVEAVIERGHTGEVYNIGSDDEMTNLDLMKTILRALGKPGSMIQLVKDRPGHDRRYSIDSTKIRAELGWGPQIAFADGIRRTVEWYVSHQGWLDRVRSGKYREYYEKHYIDGHGLQE